MLHDLANDDGYVALKQAAEDREVWRQRKNVTNWLYRRLWVTKCTSNNLLLISCTESVSFARTNCRLADTDK